MTDHPRLARPACDINHVISYGQSLAVGYEGWPALSQTQPFDSLMLGGSVRPLRDKAAVWQPVGPPVFRPLIATVQDGHTGALLTGAQVAALPEHAGHPGETVLEGALNFWRGKQLAAGGQPGAQRLLGSSCGVGQRSLEGLSKGANPDLFQRLRDCVRLARGAAEADGLSYGITALLFLQGENNNRGTLGAASGTAEYKALLRQFYRDALTDLAAAQHSVPGLFMYQTGGEYATDTQTVPQAQLECALEDPGVFMVAPSYPVTEKFGHLDPNGYRWLGAQFGKVLHRVLTLHQHWQPLHPVRAEVSGKTLDLDFHVPLPPLQWGRPFIAQRIVEPKDRGFTVLDGNGRVGIVAVQFTSPFSVQLTLARRTQGSVTARYADKWHGGRGALHDSDDEIARDCYVYDPHTGHRPGANHPALIGRPYPLQNWCVAFAIPARNPDGV